MVKKRASKRAQLAIFVIIALAIVLVLVIAFYGNIKSVIQPLIFGKQPADYVPKDCIRESIKSALNETLVHGGIIAPELYFKYNNLNINYLCYTSEWYKTCTMQVPLLKQKIESEISKNIQTKVNDCLVRMEDSLRKNYDVKTSGTKAIALEITSKKIKATIDETVTLTKSGETFTLDNAKFATVLNTNAYEMIMVASSIQNFEAAYGDSNPQDYMTFYPNLKVEKKRQSDDTKIYIITDRNTGEVLIFAIRSLAWPPGYAVQQ